MQDRWSLESLRRHRAPVLSQNKSVLSIFLRLFNENILKHQHAVDALEIGKIDVCLELLKLQNFLHLQPWHRQS